MQGVAENQDPRHGGKTNVSVAEMLSRLFQDGNQEMQALADICGIDIKCIEASIKAGEDTPLVRMQFGLFVAVMTNQMQQERRIDRIVARLASMDKGKEARHE